MRRTLPALALTLGILALFSIPGQTLPNVRLLSADKLVHIVLFAALGWTWLRAFPDKAAWIFTGGVVFSVFTEVWQDQLPIGRTGDPADAVADVFGLALATSVWLIQKRWRNARARANA